MGSGSILDAVRKEATQEAFPAPAQTVGAQRYNRRYIPEVRNESDQ